MNHYSKCYDIQTAAIITCVLGQRRRAQSLNGEYFFSNKSFNFPDSSFDNYTRRQSKPHRYHYYSHNGRGVAPPSPPGPPPQHNYNHLDNTSNISAINSFVYATSAGTAGAAGFYAPHSRSMSASYDQPPPVTAVTNVTVSLY